jgi:hypothetical protein
MQARIRQTCVFTVIAVGLVVVFAGTTLAQSSNSLVGTWKLNVANSTFAPGTAPKSSTFTIEAAGAGIKATVDSVAADGTVAHWGFTANFDGKDNPVTGDSPYGDSVASTRLDANTTQNIYKNSGTVTVTQKHVVSSDGKTDTITNTGRNAEGTIVSSERVYEKQ